MKRNIQLLSLAIFLLITSLYKAQCTANFNYTVLPSNNVNFVSTSTFTNAGTNYTWAFGDGVIAIGPTASHQYSASGVYSASLSIINTGPSCTSSTTQTISVAVTSTCNITPNFSYTINVGGVINFSNTSTGTTSLTSYSWNFDDGTAVYQTATTTHSYMSNGNYSVTLYVTDSLNYCYNSITIPILINNLPCNVNPFFTYYFGPNATISFFGNSSPYSPSNTFGWNFGDGGTTTMQNPVHSYTASGIYTVSLVTTDITGTCNATYSNTVSIIACSLTANFSYTLGNNGLVTFSNTSSSISSSTITNINWNFDDGNHGYGSPITNNYINNGVYNVHLTITDTSSVSGWCNDTITIPISVTNVTCGIGVSANAYGCNSYIVGPYINNTGCFYANITYTGTTNYTWYFGDGTQSNLLNCVHTYSLNGTYTSTFVVWDSLSPICSKTVVLSPLSITGATCNLNANFNYTNGAVGLVNFNDLSTGTSSLTNYYWNFGDGNSAFGSAIIATNNTYLSNGLYNVSLFIVDSLTPCANYTVIPVNVTNSSNTGCNANSIFSLYKDYSQNYS